MELGGHSLLTNSVYFQLDALLTRCIAANTVHR